MGPKKANLVSAATITFLYLKMYISLLLYYLGCALSMGILLFQITESIFGEVDRHQESCKFPVMPGSVSLAVAPGQYQDREGISTGLQEFETRSFIPCSGS